MVLIKKPVWTPQPKQAVFMSRWEWECLYGGAAGGGKSDALVAEALRQVHIPHYKALILRKTFPQLTELIDKSRRIYPRAFPGAKYISNEHLWRFPSGAQIHFGHMQHTQDRENYLGKAFDFIGWDELTKFIWDEYSYMFSRNRPSGPGTRCYIRATTNPGGVGHAWVRDRFIIPAPPMTTIWEDRSIELLDGTKQTVHRSRIFVPAKVTDNPALLANNPDYIANLAAMPEAERNAQLYGSWESFTGQVFTEWRNDADHYWDRKWTHVIDPFPIPAHWKIFRGMDWGYAKPFAVGWFAVDEQRRIYHIKELYGWNGTRNHGAMWEPAQVAAKIREIEHDDPMLRGRQITGIADPAIYQKTTGQSVAEIMEREHVFFAQADNSRLSGKMQLHYRMKFNPDGVPMFYVFKTCINFIDTVPYLVYDDVHVEDIDTDGEDHIYDMTRYVLMENPITAPLPAPPRPFVPDPLNLGLNRRR